MAGGSDIEWTDMTWNPVAGCSIVSPGCTNCYAMRMASRLEAMGIEKYRGTIRRSGGRSVWTGKIVLDSNALHAPLRWRKPRLVFVNSMSDLFHEAVPDYFVSAVWDIMEQAYWHQFQVLTKRPNRMAAFVEMRKRVAPNVWIGTSVESPAYLDRLHPLREAPAAVRFISFEPLLEAVPIVNLRGFDWIIVGGESGPTARPLDEQWVVDLFETARRYGASFFFKQWGGAVKKKKGRLLYGRTWDEMPIPREFKQPRYGAVAAE